VITKTTLNCGALSNATAAAVGAARLDRSSSVRDAILRFIVRWNVNATTGVKNIVTNVAKFPLCEHNPNILLTVHCRNVAKRSQ
jgi:hypothetical protein